MVKVILVSNRLPITVLHDDQSSRVISSGGGLISALQQVIASNPTIWIGWAGSPSPAGAESLQVRPMRGMRGLVPVRLDEDEVREFYEGYCNRVLWPLFHYLGDRIPIQIDHWETYRRVNQRFADAVLETYEEGDTIWVHDYHLMLLPELLRQKLPRARIGFFLHTPFPSFEVFRILPQRTDLVRGMLGADLVGFHTASY
ncbi:MAG: trehalose-6-phosphate synthase, partial [Gemmatimonadota bacterium]